MEGDGDGIDTGRRRLLVGAAAAAMAPVWLPGCERGTANANGQEGAGKDAAADGGAAVDEAEQRKRRSERRLRAGGVPVNPNLPRIEGESEVALRTAQAVAERLLALTLVAVKSDSLLSGETAQSTRDLIDGAIRERKAASLFTPKEQQFIQTLIPDRHDQVQLIWRYEAAWVLAWALRWIDGPLDPRKLADVPRLSGIVHDQHDLAQRGLRPLGEILDEADLIYRYHWATREATLRPQVLPKGLTEDVVGERHHAVNWLVGYQGQDWDEVTTDT